MLRIPTLAALLLVAGCTQPADRSAEPTDNAADSTAEVEAATVPLLEGDWLLTKVDGRPIDGGSTGVAFDGGKARVTAGCTRRAWSFTQQRNIVSFTADAGGSTNCATPPSVKQEAAFHALDQATMAIFAKGGREASLSGSGGNVTLERR